VLGLHCYVTPEQLGEAARQLAESPASHQRLARTLDLLANSLLSRGWQALPSARISPLRLMQGTLRCLRTIRLTRWRRGVQEHCEATAAIELSPDLGQPGRAFLTVQLRLPDANRSFGETLATSPSSQSFSEIPTERVPVGLCRHVLSALPEVRLQAGFLPLTEAFDEIDDGHLDAAPAATYLCSPGQPALPATGRSAPRPPLRGIMLP